MSAAVNIKPISFAWPSAKPANISHRQRRSVSFLPIVVFVGFSKTFVPLRVDRGLLHAVVEPRLRSVRSPIRPMNVVDASSSSADLLKESISLLDIGEGHKMSIFAAAGINTYDVMNAVIGRKVSLGEDGHVSVSDLNSFDSKISILTTHVNPQVKRNVA